MKLFVPILSLGTVTHHLCRQASEALVPKGSWKQSMMQSKEPCLGEREKTTLLPHKHRMRGMCFQGVDGHRSPSSLQLFVPVVPHFRRATWTRALFTFYLRYLQLVSSKAAFPFQRGIGMCLAGWELPLSPCVAGRDSRAHRAQVSQEGALCPPLPTGMPWLRAGVTSTV